MAGCQFGPTCPLRRSVGMTARPDTTAIRNPRLRISGEVISPDAESDVRYSMRPSLQLERQFMQSTHSLIRIWPEG